MTAVDALQRLSDVARNPRAYIEQWRVENPGHKVLGALPMNFPRELAHAAGMLCVLVPDDQEPIAEGRAVLPEFYCGYTRNLADQAMTGRLDLYDAIFTADHCVQLVGSADVVRSIQPERPVFFGMLATSLSDHWAPEKVSEKMLDFRRELEQVAGTTITDEALRDSVGAFNRDRRLLRKLFEDRAKGDASYSPVQMLDFVASAQVMDPLAHHDLLAEVVSHQAGRPRDNRVRVHLSGHLCHAPRRELIEVIEEAGAIVVDDDLWTGRRYLQTNVEEGLPPMEALGRWYATRNTNLPCPTRVQHDVDWDRWLLDAVQRSGAEAVVHLMPKFCEPHMLYYPELRRALDNAAIPQLLVETEHEGIPLETFRTRLEALVERARRRRPAYV